MLADLLRLRGELSAKLSTTVQLVGLAIILGLWSLASGLELIPLSLLPTPWSVLSSFAELHFKDALIRNIFYSVKINLLGYMQALAVAIPAGFIVGLLPVCRELFRKYIDATRYLPLTALTGLFIAWFGIEDTMKVQFLAFGIVVYLLPVVMQRINEVEKVYVDTIYTLGATKWQTIKEIFIPAVLSKISDDARVLVAISWTYIIVAELINKSAGGIGALCYTAARQSRIDKVFALLVVIVLIGFVQDKLAGILDKMLFPHKHTGAGEK